MPDQRSSIDEQVVKMSFDNSNFDSNINDSIKTLNNLDTKLGLLNKEDFAGLTESVTNLANVFTVKGQVMLGVFTSLGKKIVDVGVQLKNKLFAGIKDGLSEYNMIIDSTQTIYQNVKQSGATIKDVNYALDELNEYADLTIYNFSEMTRMIGMFTSAGVSLNKSVATIKGLANAAALVGANSEKAQIAWQAVSRAMSSGQFTNVVWRSLELSNIAGKQFNKVIEDVARANNVVGKSGKNIDEMIEKYGSLRLTLSEGWLTKDIFAEAMQIMSGDLNKEQLMAKGYSEKIAKELEEIGNSAKEAATQVKTFKQLIQTIGEAIGSGWAQSFRILIGDLDEAKRLFTRINIVISDFIDNNAKIRNELFTQIVRNQKDQNTTLVEGLKTGRENFEQTIENMMATVKTFFKAVSTGFLNIFPIERISAAAVKVLDVVQRATKALVLNQEELGLDSEGNEKVLGWDTDSIHAITEGIRDLIKFFRGLASAVDIAWMAFSQPIKAIVQRIPFFQNFFDKTNGGLLGILKNMGAFGDKITVVRNALKNSNLIEQAVGMFIDNIDELGERFPFLGTLLSIFKAIKNVFTGLKEKFRSLDIKPLSAAFGALKMVVTALWKALNFVFELLKKAKNSIDWSFLEGPKNAIINFIKKLSDYGRGLITFEQLTGKIGDAFKKVFSIIFSLFNKSGKIKSGVGEIQKYGTDVVTTFKDVGDKITKTGEKIKNFFAPIGEFLYNIFANADWSLDNIIKKVALLAGGIGTAAFGISRLTIELGKKKIIDNINNLLLSGIDVVKAYQKQIESKMILNIAIAIGILAASMIALALIPYDKMENGLVLFSSFMIVLATTLTPIINALTKFNRSLKYTRQEIKELTKFDVLNNLVNQLGSFGQELASGIKAKAIGQMIKDIAFSIFILVGALAALMLLFRADSEAFKKAGTALAQIIGVLAAAVLSLIIVMELFGKNASETRASVQTFSLFFKLAGVATVILSIAGAIVLLVGALAVMTALDSTRLKECVGYLVLMVSILGIISIFTSAIVALSSDTGKLRKISVSMVGAMVGIAAVLLVMKPLIETISDAKDGAWQKAMLAFILVLGSFTIMVSSLLFLANHIGDETEIWNNLYKSLAIMTVGLVAMSGVILAISQMKEIPDNTVKIIISLTVALGLIVSLLAMVSVIIAKARSGFTTDFVFVIQKLSYSIAAVIAAIGVMTAGIALLVHTLASMDISDVGIKKATTNLLIKLTMIADIIVAALPKLRKAFYNIGVSAGSLFLSFVTGFVDSIVQNGEQFLSIADKFIILIINILAKVTDLLQRKKNDIAKIFKNIISFLGTIITEVVNDVFKAGSKNKFTEDQILKLLGFTGLTVGGGAAIAEISKNFNAVTTSLKNIKDFIKGINTSLGLSWSFTNSIKYNLNYNSKQILTHIGELGIVQGLGDRIARRWTLITQAIGGANVEVTKFTILSEKSAIFGSSALSQLLWIFGAIIAAIGAVAAAYHITRQRIGLESVKIREDLIGVENEFEALYILFKSKDWGLIGQSFMEGFSKVSEAIVTTILSNLKIIGSIIGVIISTLTIQIQAIGDVFIFFISLFNKDLAFKMSDAWDGFFNKGYSLITNLFNSIEGDWNRLFDDTLLSYENVDFDNMAENMYEGMKYVGEASSDGFVSGYDADAINKSFIEPIQNTINEARRELGIASPSKVTREMYHNVMLGCILGIKDKETSFYTYLKHVSDTEIAIMAGGAAEAVAAWDEILSARGIGDTDYDVPRNTQVKIYDSSAQMEKTVELNRDYLELLLAQADAYEGLEAREAGYRLKEQIEAEGLKLNYEELADVIDAVFSMQDDKIKITADGIQKLNTTTSRSVRDLFGKTVAANNLALQNTAGNYIEMVRIAEDHKEEMVGMKEEEVLEFLKQEALKRGMTEEAATDTAKMLTGVMFAEKAANSKITASELDDQIDYFDQMYQAYYKLEEDKTKVAQEQARIRAASDAAAWSEVSEKMSSGNMNPTELADWVRNSRSSTYQGSLVSAGRMTVTEYQQWVRDQRTQAQLNDDLFKGLQETQKELFDDMMAISGMSQEAINDYWDNQRNQALNLLGASDSNKRGTFQSVFDYFKQMLGLGAGNLDFGSWDFTSKFGDTSNLGLSDGDISSAVDAAADLKDGLESQRADLTPTFDLDQLASDANKATGIVMSSLMAAQNASIGDYINKDSELNPFMKDRWQNVYNFTQNNYSPKALSRIDIYRQTQRQISMSRGF